MSTAVAVYDPAFAFEQMMKQAYEAGKAAGKKEAEAALAEVVAVTKASKLNDMELVMAYNQRRFKSSQRTGIELKPVPPLGQEKRVPPFGEPIEVKGWEETSGRPHRVTPTVVGGLGNSVSVEGAAKPEEKPAPPLEQARQAMALAKQQDGARPVIDMNDPLTQKAARDYANRVIQLRYGQGVRS